MFSINKNISKQLIEQTKQIEQLETRIIVSFIFFD